MAKSSTSFQKGQSGNVRGKPPGATPRTLFRRMVGDNLKAIVETLVSNAQAGDTAAAKVLIDRLIPALKPTTDSLNLKASGSLSEQGAALVAEMNSGKVTPDQAQAAMNVILAQSHLVDQTEVMTRLTNLENLLCPTAKA